MSARELRILMGYANNPEVNAKSSPNRNIANTSTIRIEHKG